MRWIFNGPAAMLVAAICCTSPNASAQTLTVQLPTFSSFTVNTSVVVPDSGRGFLGGVSRSAYGSSQFGTPGFSHIPGAGRLFGNRAIGADVSAATASVDATIIDLDEMDRKLRAEAAGTSPEAVDPAVAHRAAFLSRHVASTNERHTAPTAGSKAASGVAMRSPRLPQERSADTPPQPTLAPPRTSNTGRNVGAIAAVRSRNHHGALATIDSAAQAALRTAVQAEAKGQLSVARAQYTRAFVMGDEATRVQAQAALAKLGGRSVQ